MLISEVDMTTKVNKRVMYTYIDSYLSYIFVEKEHSIVEMKLLFPFQIQREPNTR